MTTSQQPKHLYFFYKINQQGKTAIFKRIFQNILNVFSTFKHNLINNELLNDNRIYIYITFFYPNFLHSLNIPLWQFPYQFTNFGETDLAHN